MVCCDVLKSRKTELLVPNQTITTDHDTDHIRVLQRLRLLSAEVLVKVVKEQSYDVAVCADADGLLTVGGQYAPDCRYES